ncbi:SRR1-like protein [Pseudophryne corroboree]|uniref:SRR1-like protein n=1 Tax=Pseudophryne corroboree TaxID=495146 RepID=UPI00308183B3
MDSDTWQVVSKKKAIKKKSMRPKENLVSEAGGTMQPHPLYPLKDCKAVTKQLNETVENLRLSDFWHSCHGCLKKCQQIAQLTAGHNCGSDNLMKTLQLKESPSSALQYIDCVCYGLGNFTSCVISRHQMAFLLLILELFKIPRHQCYIFDPIFSHLEITVLQELGMTLVLKNEEGKHAVCKTTLFYMVHCGKALYNNLLWRNWSLDALSQMIIIGNSFKGIEERLLSRILQRDYVYIHKSLQVIEETPFPESTQYSDIFNDTSIHSFIVAKLKNLPKEIWQPEDEPQYKECEDLEIIRNPRS